MKTSSATVGRSPRRARGILLIVVIGLLAILLVLGVGFLSFTRSELVSVATLRHRADCTNICYTAIDWASASIGQSLFTGGGATVDPDSYIAYSRGSGNQWWYRPYANGLHTKFALWDPHYHPYTWKTLPDGFGPPDCVANDGSDEAPWVYLPKNYFPEGGARARFMVTVLDANAFINLNDWLEDCMPTQCQMAHMFMDAYGEQELERYRSWRDGSYWDRCPTDPTKDPKVGNPNRAPNRTPIRYHEAWRVVSRTTRYPHWIIGYEDGSERISRMVSPNWVTSNTTWLGLEGAELNSLKSSIISDGIEILNYRPTTQPMPLPNVALNTYRYYPPTPNEGFQQGYPNSGAWSNGFSAPPAGVTDAYTNAKGNGNGWGNNTTIGRLPFNLPFTLYSYVDPDTGRSPVNVNTVYNSGERLPTNIFGGTPCYTMEGVFNVESLRRIIKINNMTYTDKAGAKQALVGVVDANFYDPASTAIAAMPEGTADEKENKARAWERHEQLRTKLAYQYQETLCRYFTASYRHSMRRSIDNDKDTYRNRPLYPAPPNANTAPEEFSSNATYSTAFGGTAAPVTHACAKFDYSAPRFPTGVRTFRNWVCSDLQIMATGYGETVNFDASDVPSVPPGHLDGRTAVACYDNIVPGKGGDGSPTVAAMMGNLGVMVDPLQELYNMRLARDELRPRNDEIGTEAIAKRANTNVFGYVNDPLPSLQTWNGFDYAVYSDSGMSSFNPLTDLAPMGASVDDGSARAGFLRCNLPDPGAGAVFGVTNKTVLTDATNKPRPRWLHLRPKGMDVALGGNYLDGPLVGNAVPAGPYWQWMGNVSTGNPITRMPYRQLAFGPDWFSTELTTSSTCFIFVVTAQVVDASTVAANPNNTAAHSVLFSQQWAVCQELAPDIFGENMPNSDPEFAHWYRSSRAVGGVTKNRPGEYKTATLPAERSFNQISPDQNCSTLRASYCNGRHYVFSSAAKKWANPRGITEAEAANYYTSGNQVQKRIITRAMWSLNESLSR